MGFHFLKYDTLKKDMWTVSQRKRNKKVGSGVDAIISNFNDTHYAVLHNFCALSFKLCPKSQIQVGRNTVDYLREI